MRDKVIQAASHKSRNVVDDVKNDGDDGAQANDSLSDNQEEPVGVPVPGPNIPEQVPLPIIDPEHVQFAQFEPSNAASAHSKQESSASAKSLSQRILKS